jgi:uncharacterized protein YkwD
MTPSEQKATSDISTDFRTAKPRLISIGSSNSDEYQLSKQTVTIGSHRSNDIVIDDNTVSRRHATITRKTGRFEIADLGSTNGTLVNGKRVRDPVALGRGDEIRFGSARYTFVAADDQIVEQSATPRAPVRLGRMVMVLAAMFIAGFAGVRYRSEIGSGASAVIARISARQSTSAPSAPSATNTQSASSDSHASDASTSASPAGSAAAEPGWLRRVNYYRAMAKLPPIVEDPALSKGDLAHATYLVKNFRDKIEHGGLGAEMHTEDPATPGFTPAGLEAGRGSVMDEWYMPDGALTDVHTTADPDEWTVERSPGSPEWSIDGWMSLPFHRMPLLNPRLASAGFGVFCESGACASGLNLLSGSRRGQRGASTTPIEFPSDGATIAMRSFANEYPDPLTSCPGYGPPSGVAITLQLGTDMDSHLGEYSLKRVTTDGSSVALDACGFDSTSYSNPDANSQQLGRGVLRNYGTVVLIPKSPLAKGAKYSVSITANDKKYDWMFATRP